MSNNTDPIIVSALFDIGRDSFDSRSILQYRKWLEKTSSIFNNQVNIYHDGSLDQSSFQNLLKVRSKDLEFFKYENLVSEVLKKKLADSRDISLKLPAYSLIQFSKLEFMEKAMLKTGSNSALWVDAGISRFLPQSINLNNLSNNINNLILKNYDGGFEVDVFRNLQIKKLSIMNSIPGTSRRVISGTSFWITNSAVKKIKRIMVSCIENWLENDTWDNEQVAFRNYLPKEDLNLFYWNQRKSETGSIIRGYSNGKISLSRIIESYLISEALR